jgi:hypothetical protein
LLVKVAEPLQKSFAIHGREIIPVRFLDEEMEVVGHHHVSDHTEPEKSLKFSHQSDEVLPFLVTKDEPPVNDTGDDVIVAKALPSNARLSHGAQKKVLMNIDIVNTFWQGRISDN